MIPRYCFVTYTKVNASLKRQTTQIFSQTWVLDGGTSIQEGSVSKIKGLMIYFGVAEPRVGGLQKWSTEHLEYILCELGRSGLPKPLKT